MVGPRQQAVLALVGDFVRRGVPIDGVGLQMHVGSDGTYPTAEQLGEVMAQYARLGLRVEVTEADALRPREPERTEGLAQTAAFDAVARACAAAPNCTGMTVWGVGDAYSWRSAAQRATLLDGELMPKSAYALVRCRLAGPAPADGSAPGSGACGEPVGGPPPVATQPTTVAPPPATAPEPTPGSSTVRFPTPTPPRTTDRPAPQPSSSAEGQRPGVRLVRERLGRRGLARGIALRVTGARAGTRVSVRVRRGKRLVGQAADRAGRRGSVRPVVRLPARILQTLRPGTRLRVTVAFAGADGSRTVRRLDVTIV